MSNTQSSSTSYSYSSTTHSSSSSSSSNPSENYSKSQSTTSHYNDRDGMSSERVTSETGKPTLVETHQIPASGGRGVEGGNSQGRLEDVTDAESQKEADRRYEEAMEDEYAKREGGA